MKRLAVLVALMLAGCGSPSPDLFEVHRSGADRNANLTLLVSDDGTVACNGTERRIDGDLLLRARELTRQLSEQAELNLTLPAGPNTVLSYQARMEAGTISFSDTSRPLPRSFAALTSFTSDVAEDVCGIARG
jgi:starvation-inducible outer membrane lipoprotein